MLVPVKPLKSNVKSQNFKARFSKLNLMNTDIPADNGKCADETVENLLPAKSIERYLEEYDKFIKWCDQKIVS